MIAIIDVSGNNLTSLGNALKSLGQEYVLTHKAKEIEKASHVILPGVGSAAFGMAALREHDLLSVFKEIKQPLLGICLGMQLLLDYSEEADVDCLGLISGSAALLKSAPDCPVPHMGWNQLQWRKSSSLHEGLRDEDYLYFVHSYALKSDEYALATCQYSESFAAIIQKDNIIGMQFHPEKSGAVGLQLLRNFIGDHCG